MAIAFFDLDRTLIAKNSGALWVRSEFREGYVSYTQAAEAFVWIVSYHLGRARLEDALRKSVATLEGTREAEIRDRTRRFYEREVRPLFRPGARAALHAHRRRGDRLVLLTSSSIYLSEPVVQDLKLDDFISNAFEVSPDGTYTGRAIEPLCFGPGKVERAGPYAAARGVSLADCAFYSDSASDLPMLEAVGRPVAVHPDPRLRRIARKRGWAIEDWGAPR